MKLARESRLALREIRVKAEHTRKKLKEDSLRKGKAIDGIYNVLAYLIEPLEESLLQQEQFAERQETARKAFLKSTRQEALAPFGVDVSFYDLGNMPEETFAQLLENTKLAAQAKIDAAQKAESDRIAAEKLAAEQAAEAARIKAAKDKADADERERIRKENEKLKADAKAAQEESDRKAKEAADAARKLREKTELKARKEREEIERKAAVERAALEKKAQEERRLREEAESKIRKQQESIAAQAAEEAKARKKAAKAPDREKFAAFVAALRGLKIPAMSTQEGIALAADTKPFIEKLAVWIETKMETQL